MREAIGMENYSKIILGERGDAKGKMQNYRPEERLVGRDGNSSRDDPKERAALEEHLYWARMERQKFRALSAEADEAIWNLAALARRTMQERDEARNQARMILANFQARNAQMMMLPRSIAAARSGLFHATGTSQAFAPPTTTFRPSREMMVMQGQHARTGTGYSIASSSHTNLASSMDAYFDLPPLRSFTSLVQEPFDPDMFLVDAVESSQDAVSAATGSSGLDKNSGAYEHLPQQKKLPWKGKSVLRHVADHGQAP
ncbi:hypothetical protein PR202_gb04161 [Eleusine coracana subsp. coracana]|uniref:Uncharacterized protein n=1 Tax=Eleusine coracana subsp. coracana TaxID=191504 RepID=A0AAV5E2X4_ELECO|nr:hypothetical protein PR202_gb04161 [Eleusine coracana subsp. coracana]